MTENIPNLGRKTDIQIQEAKKILKKGEPKKIHTKTHYN